MQRGRPIKIVTTATFTEVARHDWNSEDECGLFLAALIKLTLLLRSTKRLRPARVE